MGALYEFIFLIKHPKFKYLFVVEPQDLDVKEEDKKSSERYIPTPYYILSLSLKQIKNLIGNLQNSIFIDVGCGAGRTLYCSATIGFARLIGIEHSKMLTDLCYQNLKRYLSPQIQLRIINQDVRNVDFLNLIDEFNHEKSTNSLVFFLYTPFKDEILKDILNNLERLNLSFDCYIIYFGPQNQGMIAAKNYSVVDENYINPDTPLRIYYQKKVS